jgi:DNA polymerase-3 subunit beta
MKITVQRDALATAFQFAAAVAPQRSPKPILRCVKLDCRADDACTVVATDLDVGIRYQLAGVTVESPGAVLLPAAEFSEILREATDETLRIEEQENGVHVSGLTCEFELGREDPLHFPDLPDLKKDHGSKVKAGSLATMVKRTVFAAAHENSRYALNSVLLEQSDGKLRMIATDGRRLAMMEGDAVDSSANKKGDTGNDTLLSPKALALLQRIPMDPEDTVEIVVRANDSLFRTEKFQIYSRLVEGKFPKYQDVIPPDSKVRCNLLAGRFAVGLRQSKIVTSQDSRGVEFEFDEGQLMLSSRGKDSGRSEIRIPVGYESESAKLTFDPQLFLDALKVLDSEVELTLKLSDSRRATVLTTPDKYSYLVMPLTR